MDSARTAPGSGVDRAMRLFFRLSVRSRNDWDLAARLVDSAPGLASDCRKESSSRHLQKEKEEEKKKKKSTSAQHEIFRVAKTFNTVHCIYIAVATNMIERNGRDGE